MLESRGSRLPDVAPYGDGVIWKKDWAEARRAYTDWWAHKGLAVAVSAPRDEPLEDWDAPPDPKDLEEAWTSSAHRGAANLYRMSRTFYGGIAAPMFDGLIGPGSLGMFLGCEGHLAPDTVWYGPSITEPEPELSDRPLVLDTDGYWWRKHLDLLQEGARHAAGRYLIGFPDLIENLDTLAQLRDPQTVLMDMAERPDWVTEKIREINHLYFEAMDRMIVEGTLLDPWGGTSFVAFGLWGLGRTAKVQCDLCCTISPKAFRRHVQPALAAQCKWLDNSMYHLDGTQAFPQVDNLLSIEHLDAIEWTPQAGIAGAGSPEWYPLYRRILNAGKSVQAMGVPVDEVLPLIDAIGTEGVMVVSFAESEKEARELLEKVGWKSA